MAAPLADLVTSLEFDNRYTLPEDCAYVAIDEGELQILSKWRMAIRSIRNVHVHARVLILILQL